MTGKVVGKGCVGECGKTSTVEYTVESKIEIMMIVENVKTNLCTNTGAYAWMFVNGREVVSGSITRPGSKINYTARPRAQVVVHVTTYPLHNGQTCIVLGELNYTLNQMDLIT